MQAAGRAADGRCAQQPFLLQLSGKAGKQLRRIRRR
jgi:hypothetical protein